VGVGEGKIDAVDANGVILAALKGLYELVEERSLLLDDLERRLARLRGEGGKGTAG